MQSNLDVRVMLAFVAEREERLRRVNLRVSNDGHGTTRQVRRWLGHQLVRAGTRLAGEPTMRPARAR